eukprot:scaffold1486_cov78-Skeletonema_dohrnii-CCMP3373.AAC.1
MECIMECVMECATECGVSWSVSQSYLRAVAECLRAVSELSQSYLRAVAECLRAVSELWIRRSVQENLTSLLLTTIYIDPSSCRPRRGKYGRPAFINMLSTVLTYLYRLYIVERQ